MDIDKIKEDLYASKKSIEMFYIKGITNLMLEVKDKATYEYCLEYIQNAYQDIENTYCDIFNELRNIIH